MGGEYRMLPMGGKTVVVEEDGERRAASEVEASLWDELLESQRENRRLRTEMERVRKLWHEAIRERAGAEDRGWQTAHDPSKCGHPRACHLDRNWPESEKNYDPETKTSDPPMDYRCIMCEVEDRITVGLERLQTIPSRPADGPLEKAIAHVVAGLKGAAP